MTPAFFPLFPAIFASVSAIDELEFIDAHRCHSRSRKWFEDLWWFAL
jgi:hypothetical protein